jgi:hypothetical protein
MPGLPLLLFYFREEDPFQEIEFLLRNKTPFKKRTFLDMRPAWRSLCRQAESGRELRLPTLTARRANPKLRRQNRNREDRTGPPDNLFVSELNRLL